MIKGDNKNGNGLIEIVKSLFIYYLFVIVIFYCSDYVFVVDGCCYFVVLGKFCDWQFDFGVNFLGLLEIGVRF